MSTPLQHYRVGYGAACRAMWLGYLLTPDPDEVTCRDCLRQMAKLTERALGAQLVHYLSTSRDTTACGLDTDGGAVVATMFPQGVSCPRCRDEAEARRAW